MVSQRNRVLELEKYLTSIGININIGKNKARGHKGFFMHHLNNYRIDVSNNLDDESVLSVLLHEFAHYIHYSYDSSLKSLDFIFKDYTDDIQEELINVTVDDVSKDFAISLYSKKAKLENEIKEMAHSIKQVYPDFKMSEGYKVIEKTFSTPLKYLLKYDRVKIFNRLYSIDNLDADFSLDKKQKEYLMLKYKQRILRRINSRINKVNKYYNNPSELFARFFAMYYTKPDKVQKLAPQSCKIMKKTIIPQIKQIELIING